MAGLSREVAGRVRTRKRLRLGAGVMFRRVKVCAKGSQAKCREYFALPFVTTLPREMGEIDAARNASMIRVDGKSPQASALIDALVE
jgi:hypothetical protein